MSRSIKVLNSYLWTLKSTTSQDFALEPQTQIHNHLLNHYLQVYQLKCNISKTKFLIWNGKTQNQNQFSCCPPSISLNCMSILFIAQAKNLAVIDSSCALVFYMTSGHKTCWRYHQNTSRPPLLLSNCPIPTNQISFLVCIVTGAYILLSQSCQSVYKLDHMTPNAPISLGGRVKCLQ